MGAATGAANHNARVVVVTTGRFQESVTITGANGNVTLEAQPGIEANIDAVKFGSPANAGAQTVPGIIVDAPGNRRITLRNLVIRNWTDGVQVRNASHLFVDDCRIENNINHGIVFMGSSRGFVNDTEVTATGFPIPESEFASSTRPRARSRTRRSAAALPPGSPTSPRGASSLSTW
jgi:hypothetical protein